MADPLDRKVLAQDRPQYEQSVKAARQRRNKEIAAENERLSKQYELDLAEYNKQEEANKKAQEDYDRQVAEYEKARAAAEAKSGERAALEKTYADQLAELEAAKTNLINTVPFYESVYDKNTRTFVEKPIDKSQRQTMINDISRSINTQITSVQHEATSKLNQYDFSQKYPTAVLGGTVRDQFKGSLGQQSLIDIYEKHVTDKASEAEYRRRTSTQRSQNAPRYTDLQRSAIESEHVGNLFAPSPQTQTAIARAEKIKPTLPPSGTIFPTTPTMAEKQRRPLINVETGNYISGEWKPNNPVALVAGLSKQQVKEGVQIANTKTEQPVQIDSAYLYKGNEIREPSASALLKFQSRLEPNQEVPKSLYLGILQERGLPVTPFSKDIINTYASDRVKPTIKEAKGKRDTVTDPITGKSFNRETEKGDLGLGGILGYRFTTVEQPTIQLGKDVQGPPQPLWLVQDAKGNVRFDSSGNPILLKSEAKAQMLSERLADKPNYLTIPVLGGKQKLTLSEPTEAPKETWFNQEISREYNELSKEARQLRNSPLGIILAPGYAAGRSILGGIGSFVNLSEQYVDPITSKALGIKSKAVAPVIMESGTSGTEIIPYNFEKGRFDYSWKEWASRQANYIKEFGAAEYVSGLAFDYGGLKGAPSSLRAGGRVVLEKIKVPVNKKLIGYTPKMLDSEPKIYPKNQQINPEIMNSPLPQNKAFTIETINIGRGTTNISKIPKPIKTVQIDPFYKPSSRANEININNGELVDFKSTTINLGKGTAPTPNIRGTFIPKEPIQFDRSYKTASRANEIDAPFGELVEFKKTTVNLGKATAPTPPIKGKLPQPVQPDPFYKPTTRPNEIDMSDFRITDFKLSTVKLGRGTVQPKDLTIKGKKQLPVKEDYFYKPASRANEIDYTDKADAIKIPKIEMEKSEIQLDLKRELKRLKRKNPIFKTDEIKFRGEGMEIKSGKQNLVLIQKAEVATIKKLKTKRQTPVNTNWSEKIETAKLPQTGRSPTSSLLITIPKKEQKRKPYFRESSGVAVFEIPLHAQRPVIQQRERIITRSIQTPKVEAKLRSDNAIKFFQPQKLSYSVTPKLTTRQRERVDTFEKIKTSQVIKPKQIEKQTQKQATPEPLKFPSRLAQPAKLKQPTRQVFKFARPEPPRPPRTRMGGLLPPKESKIPKSVKQKQKARMDFLGSSSETQIGGLFKRQEITYGDKKISRLLQGDKRVVKGKSRTVRTSRAKFDLLGFRTKKGKAKKDTEFW